MTPRTPASSYAPAAQNELDLTRAQRDRLDADRIARRRRAERALTESDADAIATCKRRERNVMSALCFPHSLSRVPSLRQGGTMLAIAAGLCQCGCGRPTTRWADNKRRGPKAGEFARYIHGHNGAKKPGEHSRRTLANGYIVENEKYVHRIVAERALGRPLPIGAEVHHVDQNKRNNDPGNLVVCENVGYHRLLHQRQRAMDECGDPNKLRCHTCGSYDDQRSIQTLIRGRMRREVHHHRECLRARRAERAKREAAGKPVLPTHIEATR